MAERALATAFVNVVPGTADFEKVLKAKLTGSMPNIGSEGGKGFVGGFGGALSGIGGVLTASLGVGAIISFTKSLVSAAEEEVKGNARLDNIAKSMGLFGSETGTVVKRLQDYATQQQLTNGIDDDAVKATQAKLLTFKNLAVTADEAGGSFDRATKAAIDLAAAGFGSAETNAVQLGKALQDPIKGITALARSGVTFTDTEKERIKTLVESNQIGEAQALILGAIETQVGGTAAATATGSEKMQAGFDNLKETIGLALLPAFTGFTDYMVANVLPALTKFFEEFQAGKTPLNDIFNGIGGLFTVIKDNWAFISTLTVAIVAGVAAFKAFEGVVLLVKAVQIAWAAVTTTMTVVMGLMRGATIASTLAQLGLNAALIANPIGLVIAAVVALVAGLVFFFTQTKIGKDAWKAFTDFLGSAIKVAGDIIGVVWQGIQTAFVAVFNFISDYYTNFINFVLGGLNSIIDLANGALKIVNAVTGGSINIKIPKVPPVRLPKLAAGGVISTPTRALIGEAGPEVVTPLKDFERIMGIGDGSNKTINYYAAPNQSLDAEQALFQAMKRGKVLAGW